MTRTNLSAGILRRDPRAVLGMAAPPVRSLVDDKIAGMPKRVCPVCGSIYVFKTGRSPRKTYYQSKKIRGAFRNLEASDGLP